MQPLLHGPVCFQQQFAYLVGAKISSPASSFLPSLPFWTILAAKIAAIEPILKSLPAIFKDLFDLCLDLCCLLVVQF
jgi:hypothetical protein